MSYAQVVRVTVMVGVMLGSLAACEKPAGPAERAGKQLDQAVDKAGQKIEKAGDNIQDAAKGEKK